MQDSEQISTEQWGHPTPHLQVVRSFGTPRMVALAQILDGDDSPAGDPRTCSTSALALGWENGRSRPVGNRSELRMTRVPHETSGEDSMVRELAQLSRVGAFGEFRKNGESNESILLAANHKLQEPESAIRPGETAKRAVETKKETGRFRSPDRSSPIG